MPLDQPSTISDADLVLVARAGDRDAFADIYDRYADRLYGFCFSILRHADDAADAVGDTFVLAVQRLDQLREPTKLRAWLFAIARHEALRRTRQRARTVPTEPGDLDRPDAAPGLDATMNAQEAARIVWEAAQGLSERERVILDLHLRQGLDGTELADAIGVTPGHAYVLMNRLREQVDRSLGALLVARLGRADCAVLAQVLGDWDGRFSPLWRKRVARHVDGCEVCSESRRRLASPWKLLAASAMPMVPAPHGLREAVIGRMQHSADEQPAGAWRRPSARGGFPPPMVGRRRTRRLLGTFVAALVVAVGGGVLFYVLDDPGPREVRSAIVVERTEPSRLPAGPTTDTTVSTVPPPPSTTPSVPPSTSTPTSTPIPTAANQVVPPPPPTTTADVTGPTIDAKVTLACVDFQHTPQVFTASVADPSGVKSVLAVITVGANTTKHLMSGNGSQWSLSISRTAPRGPTCRPDRSPGPWKPSTARATSPRRRGRASRCVPRSRPAEPPRKTVAEKP